jgi:predicted GTPase
LAGRLGASGGQALLYSNGNTVNRVLLESCPFFADETTLNIAVFGRFEAGKSSFLNRLFACQLLSVGVIPVTSVVTAIEYGSWEKAEVRFLDGRVELPSMERYRGIQFVDTPGLESVLEHNTDASLGWLPNVGLALVAVSVDPPASNSASRSSARRRLPTIPGWR